MHCSFRLLIFLASFNPLLHSENLLQKEGLILCSLGYIRSLKAQFSVILFLVANNYSNSHFQCNKKPPSNLEGDLMIKNSISSLVRTYTDKFDLTSFWLVIAIGYSILHPFIRNEPTLPKKFITMNNAGFNDRAY
jgi:hypothetical protein